MKRIFVLISALLLSVSFASAQNGLLGALKKAAGSAADAATNSAKESAATAITNATDPQTGGALTGALSGILGDLLNTVTPVSLPGTWKYYGVATAVSSNNTLVGLASSAYKTQLENKVNGYLSQIGIKQGSAKFTFSQDGSFTIATGTKTIAAGTYTVDNNNNVEMKFGKIYNFCTLNGKLAATAGGCQILCDSGEFLTWLTKAVEVAGKFVNMSTASSLLGQVNGIQLGFTLTK